MCSPTERIATLLTAAVLAGTLATPPETAMAQEKSGPGRIVCWKDASGKTIGCGDKVPPEYQSSATREMDTRGVTRKQTESVEEANRRRAKEAESAKIKADEDRRSVEQRRQDAALLETYANEKEIDLKRDRDLQVIDSQLEQFTVALKNVTARYNEVKARADSIEKNGKPLPQPVKDDLARLTGEKGRYEKSIEAKNKEKEDLKLKYADYRKRYTELRSAQTAAAKK